VSNIGDLTHELETLFGGLAQQQLAMSPVLSDLLFSCHDRLASMVETLEDGDSPRSAPDLIAEIQRHSSSAASTDADRSSIALQREPSPDAHDTNSVTTDPELVGIFLEEAYDLINATGSALHSWSENPRNSVLAAELQRDVHTLKGGARMAGADAMGDLAHALEDLFELITRGELKPGPELYEPLFACHDRLAAMVEQIATGKACEQLPAIALAQKAGNRKILSYQLISPALPPFTESWPNAPITAYFPPGSTIPRDVSLRGIEVARFPGEPAFAGLIDNCLP
jgi:chemosensory pili system protein ChpA (sensor histidine kinase/response regulator)